LIPARLYSLQFNRLEAGFLRWLQTLGYSPSTLDSRRRNVREFLLYLERCGVMTLDQASEVKVQRYTRYLTRRKNKTCGSSLTSATINVGISSVNRFFDYLSESGQVEKVPQKLSYIKEHYQPRGVLTLEQIESLYEATYHLGDYYRRRDLQELRRATAQRDRAMLSVYYGCGLRKSEGTALRVQDILLLRKLLLVRKGKGGRERYVPLTDANLQFIREYLGDGRNHLLARSYGTTDRFFVSQYGTPLSGQALSMRLLKLADSGHISIQGNKKPSLHILRHSIATHLLNEGMDIEMIQQMLGHTSLESTQIYTHLKNEF
jgi:integrase/recombinase XerD